MIVKLRLDNNIDTNLFLRNLWSILGNNAERGWQLLPNKDSVNRRIDFGMFSCDLLHNAYMISATYERKGIINSIIFELLNGSDVPDEDVEIISKSVANALEFKKNIEEAWYSFTVKSIGFCLNKYSEDMFRIEPIKMIVDKPQEMRISLCVRGFDKVDLHMVANKKRVEVIDFLSTVVESALLICSGTCSEADNAEVNSYYDEIWMEKPPVKHKKLLMQTKAKNFINKHLKGNISTNMSIYLSASRLYHTALKYYSFIYFYNRMPDLKFVQYDASPHEIANTLFMSSLEVLSNILEFNEKTCDSCGQKVYSIRKRIIELSNKYSDDYLPKKVIDKYYNDRSSYVHAGRMYSDMSYQGTQVPTISSSGHVVSQVH